MLASENAAIDEAIESIGGFPGILTLPEMKDEVQMLKMLLLKQVRIALFCFTCSHSHARSLSPLYTSAATASSCAATAMRWSRRRSSTASRARPCLASLPSRTATRTGSSTSAPSSSRTSSTSCPRGMRTRRGARARGWRSRAALNSLPSRFPMSLCCTTSAARRQCSWATSSTRLTPTLPSPTTSF